MQQKNIGILHPGEMGISVAASARNGGHHVYWVSAGRSDQTRERAQKFGLLEVESLSVFCENCHVIISVCPPDAAENVANSVLAEGFTGLCIDANAISPQRTIRIGQAMSDKGAAFVDGGIIGGPAWKPGSTWLYLSGTAASQAAAYFSAGPLETAVIGDAIGKTSALKMCFAAYTKGTTALLCAVMAAAKALDVQDELLQQWGSDFTEQSVQKVRNVTAKAWRFTGERDEITATFERAGVPDGFHQAAGEIYTRMSNFKGAQELPDLDKILAALLRS